MKTNNTIFVTAQALSITSQLLALGIEIGIIAAGYSLYKKLMSEPEKNAEVVQVQPSKFDRIKKIWRAVVS